MVVCSPPNQYGTSQSTLLWGQRPRWHSFLPPIDVGPPPNPPLFGAQRSYWHTAFLLAHHLVSIPLRGTTRRLAYRLVSGSDTICNDPDPPLTYIVLFGLSLSGFPQGFKTRLLGEGFHTLINGGLFSSPTNVGYHS